MTIHPLKSKMMNLINRLLAVLPNSDFRIVVLRGARATCAKRIMSAVVDTQCVVRFDTTFRRHVTCVVILSVRRKKIVLTTFVKKMMATILMSFVLVVVTYPDIFGVYRACDIHVEAISGYPSI